MAGNRSWLAKCGKATAPERTTQKVKAQTFQDAAVSSGPNGVVEKWAKEEDRAGEKLRRFL